ncbi:MAG TPA: glycoside hydrolase family 3 C-terminal domain-containing protein [Burkholderiaceae bacterium]|nr:glycoside hydrolase family 3 C-terminal domain-containing protein [Burkholderiaceae bacterium]
MKKFHPSRIVAACLVAGLSACGGGGNESAVQADAGHDAADSASRPTVSAAAASPTAEARARALLARMTLDEKIQLVHGAGLGTSPIGGGGFIPGIARLGIPDINAADSSAGVNVSGKNTTPLPAPIALAASWDSELATAYGSLTGKELRTLGFVQGLGGGVNLAREPRNGRTFEYMGEDPLLSGEFGALRTKATQAEKVVATLKHFALNDQETNRYFSNSVADERTLREMHLLPFEIGVRKAAPGNIMCAYNLVNGLKACENPTLLTGILKGDWAFDGVVQSDWVAGITDTVRAATAGTDEEQPGSQDDYAPNVTGQPTYFNQKLKAAVQSGAVPLSRLDDMVLRKLRVLYRVGVMDAPPAPGGTDDTAAGDALALRAAERSAVLLKNDRAAGRSEPALPLSSSVRSVVVIGGHADVAVLSGGGAAGVPPRDGNAVECRTPGATVMGIFSLCATWYKSSPLAAIRAALPQATVTYLDGTDAGAAATAAAAADVAIIFGTQWQTEAVDLPSLALPNATSDPANQGYDQEALISAVSAQAKQTVVVLQAGTAVTMPWLSKVHAVLQAWYPGVQGGRAIANLLTGKVNPSGKLPLTYPRNERDLPQAAISANDPQVVYGEGLKIGYRWFDSKGIEPLFPFGHGLSYTRFEYAGLTSSVASNGDVRVRFTVANVGARSGAEVAQVYADGTGLPGDAPRKLIGWVKVDLRSGESRAVELTIPAGRFAVWDGAWRVRGTQATLVVGASSRAPKLTGSVTLTGRTLSAPM